EDAADDREEQALGEHLADEAAAARAERDADRELALPDRRPREEEVRDVGAGDEQHEPNCADEKKERRPGVARQELAQPRDAAGPVGVALWVDDPEALDDAGHLGARLLEPGAWRQSTVDLEEVTAAQRTDRRVEGPRHRHEVLDGRAGAGELEPGRQDADHGVRRLVDGDGAAEDGRVAAEVLLPGLAGEDDDVVLALVVLAGSEAAPHDGPDAEHIEEVRRRGDAAELPRRAVAGERRRVSVEPDELAEALRLRAQVEVVGPGERARRLVADV